MAEPVVEREVKLAAWPGFKLPELGDVAPWVHVVDEGETVLDAVYLDAPDLRLIRAGITLRHRSGEGGDTGRWTLKLPYPGPPGSKVTERYEVSVDAPFGEPPAELVRGLHGVLRAHRLVTVAHLRTVRRRLRLHDPAGRPLGEVADDEVTVLEDERVAARFREVEVEVAPGAPDHFLDLVVERLRSAGAGDPETMPKLVRALGPRALAPPDPAVPPLDPQPSAASVVRSAIATSVLRLLNHDPIVRLDLGSHGVHQARVSTRRLRSDLRTFGLLVDPIWGEELRAELKWLADALGAVRDLDVLGQRLSRDAETLGDADREGAAALLATLTAQRDERLAELHELFESERYYVLLDRLVEAAREPALTEAAGVPAKQALPSLVAGPWRKLRRDARKLGPKAPDEALHALRIRAKRARYAAEAIAPAVKEAAPLGEVLAELQGILGELHDTVVAEGWLRQAATNGAAPAEALAAGLLIAEQRAEAARRRVEWLKVWAKADSKRLTRWLDR